MALALVGRPRVVFLDELTTGLDPQARRAAWDAVRRVRDAGVTVVLVSHAMEEVAALCDRAAVLHGGRIVACGSPQELVAGVGATVSFRPSGPLDEAVLAALPGVRRVSREGGTVTVSGVGAVVDEVTGHLARLGMVVTGLRIEQAGLEDAYLALVGGAR
ncbi:hypothetical protein GCM10025734_26110 [Kitasatospora paranensis]